MVAELALDRGDFVIGLDNYVEQARNTDDVNIVARATQIARILGRHSEALEMANMWRELDPGSREARMILVSELISAKQYALALEESQLLIKAGESAPIEEIAIDAARNKSDDLAALRGTFEDLRSQYPNSMDVLIGLSILQEAVEDLNAALISAEKARAIGEDDARALYQHYRILTALNRDEEAALVYGKVVDTQPDNFRIRSHYARMLIKLDREAALEQYRLLGDSAPDNNDIKLNLALLLQDTGRHEEAETLYTELVDLNEHTDVANFWLGEIAENKGNLAKALQHYLKIGPGKRYVDAASRAADVLVRTEGIENALVFLGARREAATEADKERLYLIEADTLSRSNNNMRAESIYSQGIREFPDSIGLLYGRAMHFAANGDYHSAEADFLRVLEIDPDNAATLNALGYTLADSNIRLEEAKGYIERALSLRPGDPAILDSMGWVEFKLDNPQGALEYLAQAFEITADHEIAAHYGEVLWLEGKKRQAKNVWQRGLENNPSSKIIQNTMQRLNVK